MVRADNRDRIPILVVCEGRTISLELGSRTSFDDLLGQKVEVSVVNLHDTSSNRQGSVHTWSFKFAVFNLCKASVDVLRVGFSRSITDALVDSGSCGRRLESSSNMKKMNTISITSSGGVQIVTDASLSQRRKGRKLLSSCELTIFKDTLQTQLSAAIGIQKEKLNVLRAEEKMNAIGRTVSLDSVVVDLRIASQCGRETDEKNNASATMAKDSKPATEYAVLLSKVLLGENPHVGDVVKEEVGGRRQLADDTDTDKYVLDHYDKRSEIRVSVIPSQDDPATVRHSQGLLSDANAAGMEDGRNDGSFSSETVSNSLHAVTALSTKLGMDFVFIILILGLVAFVVLFRCVCDTYDRVHRHEIGKGKTEELAKVNPASSVIDALRHFKPKKGVSVTMLSKDNRKKNTKVLKNGAIKKLGTFFDTTVKLPIEKRWLELAPRAAGIEAKNILVRTRLTCDGGAKGESYLQMVVLIKKVLRQTISEDQAMTQCSIIPQLGTEVLQDFAALAKKGTCCMAIDHDYASWLKTLKVKQLKRLLVIKKVEMPILMEKRKLYQLIMENIETKAAAENLFLAHPIDLQIEMTSMKEFSL